MVRKIFHVFCCLLGGMFLSVCAGGATLWVIHWITEGMAFIGKMEAQTQALQSMVCL